MLQDWEKLGAHEKEVVQEKLETIVNAFAREQIRGKVFMKLGRNGRLFYRLCTLDKQLTAFSMHIKGAIVEYPFTNVQQISFGYDLTDFTHVPVSFGQSENEPRIFLADGTRRIRYMHARSQRAP